MPGSLIRSQQRLPLVSRGVSLLIVIVILGSALLIISAGALLIGLSQRESGFVAGLGGEARALADGCMNEAYVRIARNASWGLSGAVPFTAPNGSCTILVSDLGGNTRSIDVVATRNGYVSHIRTSYATGVGVSSWEERSD